MAYSIEQARELLLEHKEHIYITPQDLASEPKIYDTPAAVAVYGGG